MTGLTSNSPRGEAQETTLPPEFVYLLDVDPSIIQDIRYAGANNFFGKPVPGYEAAECLLLRPVAVALMAVQSDLARDNLSLKVYDCYRPLRAVQAFAAWAQDGKANNATKRFYPQLSKNQLFSAGYISSKSSHTRGNAVDLTLVPLSAPSQAAFDPKKRYGSCAGPVELRAPDNSVDMGTGFDCFDAKSRTASPEISPEQRGWRQRLLTAMQARGFTNYAGEWWHFSYPLPGTGPLKAYDFPILPRAPVRVQPSSNVGPGGPAKP